MKFVFVNYVMFTYILYRIMYVCLRLVLMPFSLGAVSDDICICILIIFRMYEL